MVRRKRDVAIIVLRCVIFGCCASAQQAAFGTGVVTPSLPAGGGYVLVVQADMPVEPQAIVQETKNADASAEPQAVMQEIKSATRLSGSKQRRRKPKMAGVPDGSRVVAQETKEPGSQAVAQETKEPGSQAVAQENEEADTLDKPLAVTQETKNANVSAKPQTEVNGLKAEGVGKKRYGMAPVRWGGRITETVGLERHSQTVHGAAGSNIDLASGRSGGIVINQTAEIHATTYIVQPYIAQLGGNIGVFSNKNANSINSTNGINNTNGSRNNQLFGDGSLSLFSQSRFPFDMSLGVGDDRANSEFDTQDTASKYLNLRQSYRPLGSASMYKGGYSRSTQTTNTNNWSTLGGANPGGTATRSVWDGGYSTSTSEHRTNATIRYNEKTTNSFDNITRRTDDFTVQDTYLPTDSLLSLQSFANLNLFADNSSRTRYLLANTNAAWQPEDEDLPLFVDGGAYLFKQLITTQGVATTSQSLGGNVGARYLFSKNLTGRVDGDVTSTNDNGARSLATTQRGRVTYLSNAVKLWKNSSYSWNANGGAANHTNNNNQIRGAANQADTSVFGGVGHGLFVPYTFGMFGKKWQTRSAINQSLDANIGRVDGRSITLSNGGSVSLGGLVASVRPDKELLGGYGTAEGAMNTMATLSVNDRRTWGGGNPVHSRTYSLTLTLLETSKSVYSRYGIEVEATLGAVQGINGTEFTGTGTAKYKKRGVFNVRGLDYMGSLKINSRSSSRAVDVNAQNPRFPWELDQRLIYKIGQNEVLLKGLVFDQYGVKSASLWLLFKAWRTIGN